MVKPYFVSSKMSKIRKTSVSVPDANTFVRSALSLVGVQADTTGYWAHHIEVMHDVIVVYVTSPH